MRAVDGSARFQGVRAKMTEGPAPCARPSSSSRGARGSYLYGGARGASWIGVNQAPTVTPSATVSASFRAASLFERDTSSVSFAL